VAIEPYHQGDLDHLCGLYAVVNSIGHSLRNNSPMDEPDCQKLFNRLVEHLRDTGMLARALTSGLSTAATSRMLAEAQSWLLKTKGVKLRRSKPFHRMSNLQYSDLINSISMHLAAPNTSVLASISGRMDHWTVIREISPKSIMLFDSYGISRFSIQSTVIATASGNRNSNSLVPSGCFFIETTMAD
jgi:hypothetical protein